jgi:Na+-translocating ferredoxin:NAD+ oxidoreductase RNF subunit RnfB
MLALTAVAAIGGLTVLLATLLVLANKKLYVEEDPRIDVVEEMLPHANCGACGVPGCRPFAESLVRGDALPGKCTVSSEEGRARIATFLGVDVGAEEKRVARVACMGGSNVTRNHARYDGLMTCRAAAQVAGGGKGCFWGCLGLDDCCEVSHRLWVACRSLEAGDELLEDCEVACTACGRCAMDAPGLIVMENNLAVVDYERNHETRAPIERCPTGAIVWIDPVAGAVKGQAATRIIRKGALPDAPT